MRITISALLLVMVSSAAAQNIGIGTVTPDATALLDITSTQKGLLIPRLSLAQRNNIAQPATSLLIYQTDGIPGFYYNAGSPAAPLWTSLSSGSGSGTQSWLLSGNTGTDSANNFIGTSDNLPLLVKVNNQLAGKIDSWSANTFYGYQAANAITTGKNDVAIGWHSLVNTNSGSDNVAIGKEAMMNNTVGNGNISVGGQTLRNNVNGAVNICIGYGAEVAVQNLTNATAIGWSVNVNASNKVVIGTNTTGMVVGGFVNWSNLSDGRFKENVKENVPGLSFINKLRPVTYTVNTKKLDEHVMSLMPGWLRKEKMKSDKEYASSLQWIRTGFIAQEVEAAAMSIGYNFDGVNKPTNPADTYSLSYASFVVPLVKAIQEQQVIIQQLQKEVKELRKKK